MLIEIKYLSTSAFTFCYNRINFWKAWKVFQLRFTIWSLLEFLEMSRLWSGLRHTDTDAESQLSPAVRTHYFNDTCS